MKIKMTSLYVDDQDKALRFYTEILGFTKKTDFSQGPYRWLTVASPEEPDGTELQLALNNNPAAKAYQQAIFQQHQPAAMFYSGPRTAPPAGKSLAGDHRSGTSPAVGALRRRWQPGYGRSRG
jgi:catechol 2,3-dioxygenase-like lactoylglutathione lyase family enzyme